MRTEQVNLRAPFGGINACPNSRREQGIAMKFGGGEMNPESPRTLGSRQLREDQAAVTTLDLELLRGPGVPFYARHPT